MRLPRQHPPVVDSPAPATTTRQSGNGTKTVVSAAVGYGVDGFDNLMVGLAIIPISMALGLTKSEAGSLATVTLLGAVLGGLVFGPAADRYGRVRVMTWSIVLFAVFTGLTAAAQNYDQLVATRFVAGIGLGGEFGVGMAMAAEAWPAIKRARATSWVAVGGQLGPIMGILVAGPVLTYWNWRALFVIGAIPAVLAFVLRRTLSDSSLFVERRADLARNSQRVNPFRALVADRRTAVTSTAIIVLCSVQNFGYYGIMTWLPTYLSKTIGLSINKSSVWTATTVAGMAVGMVVFGRLADRFGRKKSFWVFQLGAIISVLTYSQLTQPLALLVGGAVLGVFVNGMLGGYGALMAELYPTEVRATAQNTLFNIGRGVGGFAPVVFAFVAASHGFAVAIALLSVLYAIDMVAVLFIPEKTGVELK